MSRIDTAVRVISASPDRCFAALTDSDSHIAMDEQQQRRAVAGESAGMREKQKPRLRHERQPVALG